MKNCLLSTQVFIQKSSMNILDRDYITWAGPSCCGVGMREASGFQLQLLASANPYLQA